MWVVKVFRMCARSQQISHSHIIVFPYLVVSFARINTHRYVHTTPTHTHTSSAVSMAIPCIPQHKQQHLITRGAVGGKARINFCDVTLSASLDSVHSYIVVAVETCYTDKYKGPG